MKSGFAAAISSAVVVGVLGSGALPPEPIRPSQSASPIAEVERVWDSGLHHELHANGTNLEGEWDAVMAAIRTCHERLPRHGRARVSTPTSNWAPAMTGTSAWPTRCPA